MTMLRLPFLTALCLCLPLTGCDSDNEEVTATASESGESSGMTGTGSASGGSSDGSASTSGNTDDASSTGGVTGTTEDTAGSSETGALSACGGAFSESDCQDTESTQCAWFPTSLVVLDAQMVCQDVDQTRLNEGYCLEVDPNDPECGFNFAGAPCNGGTVLYAQVGLEIGAVEVFVFDEDASLCEIPSGFDACLGSTEPGSTELTYFPLECGCICEN